MSWLYAIIAILLIGIIVTVHEFGHYLVGRLCGIGIEEFSVGFGPKLVSKVKKGIRYSVRLIPLGGYTRFVGEDANSDDPRAMNNASVWKRILTVAAGPLTNFLFGYLLVALLLFTFGIQQTVPLVAGFLEGKPAAESGLQVGDQICALDGVEIDYSAEGKAALSAALGAHDATKPVQIDVLRGTQRLSFDVDLYEDENGAHMIGITLGTAPYRMALGEGLSYAAKYIAMVTTETLASLRDLVFRGQGADQMMGYVGIVGFMTTTIPSGVDITLNLIALISVSLGIANLLPLPALDGGRLVFLLVEAIRRKPINRDREGLVHLIGFGALLLVILFVTYKDIARLIAG